MIKRLKIVQSILPLANVGLEGAHCTYLHDLFIQCLEDFVLFITITTLLALIFFLLLHYDVINLRV